MLSDEKNVYTFNFTYLLDGKYETDFKTKNGLILYTS